MITLLRLETLIIGPELHINGTIRGHLTPCANWLHNLGHFLFRNSRWRIDKFTYYPPVKTESADKGVVEFKLVRLSD